MDKQFVSSHLMDQDLANKHKFQLIHVAQTRITFAAESHDEMVAWQNALRDATAQGLSSNSDRLITLRALSVTKKWFLRQQF